jgi:4-hydroxy-tetrahydrodipicolinate reductase
MRSDDFYFRGVVVALVSAGSRIMRKKPFRVAVWGPGGLGSCAIRELKRLPEVDLVGVFAYSESKIGKDVGTLVGHKPYRLKATGSADELIATKPECVIYTARDYGDFRADADIEKLLKAGINVITPLAYQYPKMRGKDVLAKFNRAGRKGKATLFGTGVNPGFIYERLVATLTGISNGIESISLREFFNAEHLEGGGATLSLFGFGSTAAKVEANPIAAMMAQNYLTADINYLADMLGVKVDKIERSSNHGVTDKDINLPGVIDIKAGTLGRITFRWTGYVKKKPFFVVEVNWCLTKAMMPPEAKGDDFWLVEIEGQPSCRMGLEVQGSFKRNEVFLPNNPSLGAYMATVMAMVQAIPHVIKAPPGVMLPQMPQMHWKPDMRA